MNWRSTPISTCGRRTSPRRRCPRWVPCSASRRSRRSAASAPVWVPLAAWARSRARADQRRLPPPAHTRRRQPPHCPASLFRNRVPMNELTAAGWLAEPVCLRPGVEVLVGADDQRLLFIPGPGRYLRLTAGAARLVPLLDGRATGTQLVDRVTERTGRHAREAGIEAGRSVVRLLDQLRRAGALTAAPEPTRPASRFHRRLPLTRSVHRLLRRPGALLRRIPVRVAGIVVLLGTVMALVLAVTALVRS